MTRFEISQRPMSTSFAPGMWAIANLSRTGFLSYHETRDEAETARKALIRRLRKQAA